MLAAAFAANPWVDEPKEPGKEVKVTFHTGAMYGEDRGVAAIARFPGKKHVAGPKNFQIKDTRITALMLRILENIKKAP